MLDRIVYLSLVVGALAACSSSGNEATNTSQAMAGASVSPSLFDAQNDCKTNGLGQIWKCAAKSAMLHSAAPTQTDDDFVKAMAFKSRFTYEFICNSSQPLKATFAASGSALSMTTQPDPAAPIQGLPWIYAPYNGIDLTITVAPVSLSVVVQPGCHFRVIDNQTLPVTPSLQWYLADLQQEVAAALDLQNGLAKAAELPAKWSYVKTMPDTLKKAAARLQVEIDALDGERAQLQTRKNGGEALSSYEGARLSDLSDPAGMLAVKRAQVNQWKSLAADVQDILGISGGCEQDAPGSACVLAVGKLEDTVGAMVKARNATLTQLSAFITAESARVQNEDAQVSADLRALLQPEGSQS